MMSRHARWFAASLVLVLTAAAAAPLLAHNQSPRAGVTQMIGMTKVTVDYGRPGVKDRAIWGELVPYGELWKTGADRMTNITFDKPLRLGGEELAAGTYGILTLPSESGLTFIFTKSAEIHMPSRYSDDQKVLEIETQVESAEQQERLAFTFDNLTMDSADLVLHWEKRKFRIPVAEVGGHE